MSTRINVMFPNDLLEQIRDQVPDGKRSQFIVQATRDLLIREKQREAIDRAAGAWNEASQAYLDTDEGIETYLNQSRCGSDERQRWLESLG